MKAAARAGLEAVDRAGAARSGMWNKYREGWLGGFRRRPIGCDGKACSEYHFRGMAKQARALALNFRGTPTACSWNLFSPSIHLKAVQSSGVLKQNFLFIVRFDVLEILCDLLSRMGPEGCAVRKV